ncbi:MAG: acyltransferase [Cyanobacteria bacterium P01_F01_bin.143]
MTSKTFLVQANRPTQKTINCTISDQLFKNIPVSVVFFYRKNTHQDLLIDVFKEVLSDFPVFAERLQNIDGNLAINCNNQGVLFSVAKDDMTLDNLLKELPIIKKKRLVDAIDPKKVISQQNPILTIKVIYFACGGMTLGLCWHHSIGDMYSFMCLMKAWSNKVNQKEYTLPLIVEERDKYLQENLEDNGNTTPNVRYLNTKKFLGFLFYLLFSARDKSSFGLYFSENELKNMKEQFSEKTGKKLSINDVLCAHLFSIISELDTYNKKRYLSIVVNYRNRVKLPQNILGNFISFINVLTDDGVKSFPLATELRASVNNFQRLHMSFFATKEYIEQNGGTKKIAQFIPIGIDPLNRTLLITNWSKFGVYDVTFGNSEPFYFTPFGNAPSPWLSVIVEGFSNKGLVYYVSLPKKLVKKLKQKDNIARIHQYRDQEDVLPELAEKLGWLF